LPNAHRRSDGIAENAPLDIDRHSSRLTVRKKHKSTVLTENSVSMCGPVSLPTRDEPRTETVKQYIRTQSPLRQ